MFKRNYKNMSPKEAIEELIQWLSVYAKKYPTNRKFIAQKQECINTLIDHLNNDDAQRRLVSLRWFVSHHDGIKQFEFGHKLHIVYNLIRLKVVELEEINERAYLDIIKENILPEYQLLFDSMPFSIKNYSYYLDLIIEEQENKELYDLVKNDPRASNFVNAYEQTKNILDNLRFQRL
jgi:hypothetical protein